MSIPVSPIEIIDKIYKQSIQLYMTDIKNNPHPITTIKQLQFILYNIRGSLLFIEKLNSLYSLYSSHYCFCFHCYKYCHLTVRHKTEQGEWRSWKYCSELNYNTNKQITHIRNNLAILPEQNNN